jgi:nonribosomal peptide synthetase DhbF
MEQPVSKDLPLLLDTTRLASIEHTVREIWRKSLHIDEIGAEDNFFELGGDSMMLMSVLSMIRSEFGVDIDHGTIFQSPTLRDLCELVAALASSRP